MIQAGMITTITRMMIIISIPIGMDSAITIHHSMSVQVTTIHGIGIRGILA
jgi:hypothetical protein